MCGICGYIDLSGNRIDDALLERMTLAIRHRGPDGMGRFVDRDIGLGHRRLSIIDVGGGAQPIGNEDGSIQVVFNGEIYNFIELRAELEAAGHLFKTHSDTEVIVHAYEQWGVNCVSRFNGMFAFALWNAKLRELFLARDHLGIKPLYYTTVGQHLVFASEVKSLLEHPGYKSQVDINALSQLFTFRYVPSPETLFRGIKKLPPGHWMRVRDRKHQIERYWDFIPKIRTTWRLDDLVDEYQSLLESAVRLQLRSDVPLGLFLSSGVDSAVLLALMSKHGNGPVQAFTIGFENGSKTNEVAGAAELAKLFGADHHVQMIGPSDYIRYYDRYMSDLEEPVGNESAAAFYFVSRLSAKHVKVVLSGQGADEPWGGYDRHWGAKVSAYYSKLPGPITRGIAGLVGRLPGRMERLQRGVASLNEPDMLLRFAKVYSFFSAELKAELFRGELQSFSPDDPYAARFALQRLQQDVTHLDPLSQMLYVDTRSNLPDDLLMVGDKTSMACSIEGRVPFLDVRLVEFIESLPPHLKVGFTSNKYLHRLAIRKWLPRSIARRKKLGFANPIEEWLRTDMRSHIEELLLSPASRIATYFDQAGIRKLMDNHRSGRAQHMRHIYLLLSLELWMRRFKAS